MRGESACGEGDALDSADSADRKKWEWEMGNWEWGFEGHARFLEHRRCEIRLFVDPGTGVGAFNS